MEEENDKAAKWLKRVKIFSDITFMSFCLVGIGLFLSVLGWDGLTYFVPLFLLVQIIFGTFSFIAYRKHVKFSGLKTHQDKAVAAFFLAFTGLLGWALVYLVFQALGAMWGRPLRLKGRILYPGLTRGSDWALGARPVAASLAPATRKALEMLWLHDAQKEHASVPAFARLSWQLIAMGAPPDLIRDTHLAALQEIEHARLCFALAAGYGGRAYTVEPMPELLKNSLGLKGDPWIHIGVECLNDGCVLEDYNADVAQACATSCEEPATKNVLETIAREERVHAELSWRILEFCLTRGGAKTARAVTEAAAEIGAIKRPTACSPLTASLVAAADPAELARHGRLPDTVWAKLWEVRLAITRKRLTEMLRPLATAA